MTLLHAHFHLRNQQAFQRLLDGSSNRGQSSSAGGQGLSGSGGKSWNRPSPLSSGVLFSVNARDWLGRTVLHLAAAAQDTAATEYVRLLLAHPDINVNLQDTESHWTALHRALYHGNLASAVLLLQRADIDTSLRDFEGYTAFDLYNSTLEGTQPVTDDTSRADLLTWGANRNAALGLGNGDDRSYPELVVIRPADGATVSANETLDTRFSPIHVRQVAMSKLHTAVVTAESRGNLRVCGFGSGGRLGPGQHTQYSLTPMPQFSHTIVSVALGQDHTLALTKSGEVLSWGLNRFSQLGYVVEQALGVGLLGRLEEPVQAIARKVAGPLKNKNVKGVAACKTASACWTSEEVFTWGTNKGQLGYDKSAHPVQILPRLVTKISQPVISITITDTTLACLLSTKDVICLWNDGHFKVNFPAHSFPSEMAVYRPPQATNNASIEKITSCENTFAALSSNGELFTFTLPAPSEAGASSSRPRAVIVPQRVWALRKKFSAVRDVALGADGSIIICTESGHVFVRSRNIKAGQNVSSKSFQFQRMPYIQRVVKVCANATGAYGALRIDCQPEPIKVVGNLIAHDLADIQPYLRLPSCEVGREDFVNGLPSSILPVPPPVCVDGDPVSLNAESDDEEDELHIQKDVKQLESLCLLLHREKNSRKGAHGHGLFENVPVAYGADVMVLAQSSGFEFPAHRLILAARCPLLGGVLSDGNMIQDPDSNVTVKPLTNRNPFATLGRISFSGCHAMSILILMAYIYSDEVLSIWDRRIGHAVEHHLGALKIKPTQIKSELQSLARMLDLPRLAQALQPPVKRSPSPSMVDDMRRLFQFSQMQKGDSMTNSPLRPDVILQLDDRNIFCHSIILRARSPFFAAFFDDEDWTRRRWNAQGMIEVNLRHLKWRAMDFVLRFLCYGADQEMFDILESVGSVDEVLDFMFDVMAAANELLLDRLILICSVVILKRVTITNVCSILTDAAHFYATTLVNSLHSYLTANMETLLESRMLDDLIPGLIRDLSVFVRKQQALKYPTSRSSFLIDKAMKNHGDWLAMQDIAQIIVPTNRSGALRDSPKLSPPSPNRRHRRQSQIASLPNSPIIRPQLPMRVSQSNLADDEVFIMDDPDAPTQPEQIPITPTKSGSGWKTISAAPRSDMRAIMAEAQVSTVAKRTPVPPPVSRAPSGVDLGQGRTPPRDKNKAAWPLSDYVSKSPSRPSSASPWKVPQAAITATTLPLNTPPSSSTLVASVPASNNPRGASTPQGAGAGSSSATPHMHPHTLPRSAEQVELGPVFTPSKQSPGPTGSSSIRRVSSGNAWTLPPVQPIVQSSGSVMSFAAIQQSQLEQHVEPIKDKRSLREIQEEEQARQVEEDFLRWWAAEEQRLKAEEQAAIEVAGHPIKSKKPKRSRGKVSAPSQKGNHDERQGSDTRRSRTKDSAVPKSTGQT
ncbi:hypothetical protein AcW1_006352 [Taiwanofungus camphoratus]|nr:hypothetical protein AcW2_005117 [Antrodia cinnamomea]KAI0954469.1 hypothetical protein AcW1_006352 [Antrodia cinnamomea]